MFLICCINFVAIMSAGEQRRSTRISEMDARRAQNKGKRICEAAIEDSNDEEVDVKLKRGSKKTKTRPIQNLVVKMVENRVQKVLSVFL